MGMGRFKNGRFDLVVVANFAMTATDVTEWRRSFQKASELFWDASEGNCNTAGSSSAMSQWEPTPQRSSCIPVAIPATGHGASSESPVRRSI